MTSYCNVEGCEDRVKARGLCGMHYQRARTTGTPGLRFRKIASKGSGTTDKVGYRRIKVDGKQVYEHRHVMEQMLGRKLLPAESVHHKNSIKHDNRPENLELWSRMQPNGHRVVDLLMYVVENYPNELLELLNESVSTEPFQTPS
jgi:hypothetical protein